MAKRRWLDWAGPVPGWAGGLIPESIRSLRASKTLLTLTTWDRVRLLGDSEHEPWVMRHWAGAAVCTSTRMRVNAGNECPTFAG
jgi:hypothetical protein